MGKLQFINTISNKLPILMLTAKNQISDLVAGLLRAGDNDYLTKLIAKNKLLARVKALTFA
ncbi:MAG: hypothetical protein QM487_13380 [Candidatus Marithrix sp.]